MFVINAEWTYGNTAFLFETFQHYNLEEMPKYRKTLRRQNEPEFAVYI